MTYPGFSATCFLAARLGPRRLCSTFPFSHTHFLTCEPRNVLAAISTAETQTPFLPHNRCTNAQPNRCCSCLWHLHVFNSRKRGTRKVEKKNKSIMLIVDLIYDQVKFDFIMINPGVLISFESRQRVNTENPSPFCLVLGFEQKTIFL